MEPATTPEQRRRKAQDNAFRKVALKGGHLPSAALDRAFKEQQRLAATGTQLAVFQVALRMRLLSIAQVKAVLGEVKQRYVFCSVCQRENVKRPNGKTECKYCSGRVPEPKPPAPPADADPWVGQVVGACKLLAKLGAGGSGTVYKARQLSLDRLVAVKLLFPWLALKDDHARRFLREGKAMARVEHPNVVPIFDYGRVDSTYYLVMSYQEGQTLARKVAEAPDGRLPIRTACEVVCGVLDGLEAMHSVGVIHRDLKPDNIQITPSGRAVVMDFGLVRHTEGAESLTASEQIVGTPYYMAPEQCLNREVDARSDIYSLGVTFYQLVTGERPFTGSNAVELIMSHLGDRAAPVHEVVPGLPEELSAVIERMLAKDKRNRYQSAARAREDVERLLAGEAPRALTAPPEVSAPASPRTGSPPRSRALVGGIAAALVLLIAYSWAGARPAPVEPELQTPVVDRESVAAAALSQIRSFCQAIDAVPDPASRLALLKHASQRLDALIEDEAYLETEARRQALALSFDLTPRLRELERQLVGADPASAVARRLSERLEAIGRVHARGADRLARVVGEVRRLVGDERFGQARALVAGGGDSPAERAVRGGLEADVVASEQRWVTVALRRLDALRAAGEFDAARALVARGRRAAPAHGARWNEQALITDQVARKAAEEATAHGVAREKRARREWLDGLRRTLAAADLERTDAWIGRAPPEPMGDAALDRELATLLADRRHLEAIDRQLARELATQVGKRKRLLLRIDGQTRKVSGTVARDGEGFAIDGRSLRLANLAPEAVEALVGRQLPPLDLATYLLLVGAPRRAMIVLKTRRGAEQLALWRRLREAERERLLAAARRALRPPEGKAADPRLAYRALRDLASLAPAVHAEQTELRALLAQRAAAEASLEWDPEARVLYEVGKPVGDEPKRWDSQGATLSRNGDAYLLTGSADRHGALRGKKPCPLPLVIRMRLNISAGAAGPAIGNQKLLVGAELASDGSGTLLKRVGPRGLEVTRWPSPDGDHTVGVLQVRLIATASSQTLTLGSHSRRFEELIPAQPTLGLLTSPKTRAVVQGFAAHQLTPVAVPRPPWAEPK